ncbi:MAG: SAP domain-containing protein, partial [Burkholderiales bacterium]
MSIALRDALARLTVPELKDLVSHLPGAETAGRKDQLIARIIVDMLGPGLQAVWSALDPTQQSAVAEAAHNLHGEYSEQRFNAKYQRVPSFREAAAKPHGYSGSKASALGLFIYYTHDERRYFIPADLQARLKVVVPPPAPLSLASAETLADDESLIIRLTEREALNEVVVMLRTIEQARIQVSEKTALPSTAALRTLTEKLMGGDFYHWGEKKNKWDQEIGPIKAFAWPMLLQAGALAIRSGGHLALSPAGVKALSA